MPSQSLVSKSFTTSRLNDYGLANSIMIGDIKSDIVPTFVWLLKSTNTSPQPNNVRGIWTNTGVWSSTGVWYG